MFIEIQAKSLSKELVQTIVDEKLSEHCCLVTDDTMVDALLFEGHLSRVYRQAIALGLPVEEAIYLCTYTPARRMGLTDRGSIAPGRLADFLLVDNLKELSLKQVYKNGQLVVAKEVAEINRAFPERYYHSVNLKPLTDTDFVISAEGTTVECRVMEMSTQTTFTEEGKIEVPIALGLLDWEKRDVAMVAVFDRYTGTYRAYGFARGACIKKGAVATTYAHDHHNLLVLGHTAADMLKAANWVIELQGGMVAVLDGEVKGEMHLPVAGILSDQPLKKVASDMKKFRTVIEEFGWEHHNPIMSLGTLSLPVSPALKISDQGLIDVRAGKIVPLTISKN